MKSDTAVSVGNASIPQFFHQCFPSGLFHMDFFNCCHDDHLATQRNETRERSSQINDDGSCLCLSSSFRYRSFSGM